MNNIKPSLYWSEKIIMAYLIQAASIHRRLPNVRVPGYFTLWPASQKDEWENLYDMLNAKSTLGYPMAPEVTFSEEVMDWLRQLDRNQQCLVWSRANRVPWKILTEEFGRSRASLFRDFANALHILITHLNRTDLRGEHFKQLKKRANDFIWFDEIP